MLIVKVLKVSFMYGQLEEINEILDKEEANSFVVYDIKENGNFNDGYSQTVIQ